MIIYAINISTGGGKVLLDELLLKQSFGPISTVFIDVRYSPPPTVVGKYKFIRIAPKLLSRWRAEIQLKAVAEQAPSEEVLAFGNLPPALKLKNKVILYLQNAFLLPEISAPTDNLKLFLRICYERIWLRLFLHHVSEIWVQTHWMRDSLKAHPLTKNIDVQIRLLLPTFPPVDPYLDSKKKFDYVFITGSGRHKYLDEVLEMWSHLPVPRPTLAVITDGLTPHLRKKIELSSHRDSSVEMFYRVSREEVFRTLGMGRRLLVCSRLESLYLPLYEARHFGLPIVGLRAPYLEPADDLQLFDDLNQLAGHIRAAKEECGRP